MMQNGHLALFFPSDPPDVFPIEGED